MESKNERTPSQQPQPAEQPPTPRKRFRIEKLEERIAPKKKGGGSQGGGSLETSLSGGSGGFY